MRIEAQPSSKTAIFLDGELVKRAVAYDLEEGYVEVVQLNGNGSYVVSGDELHTIKLRGAITIQPKVNNVP